MNQPANKVLISMAEALQTISNYAPEVLVLEVVSDYYQQPALQQYRASQPVPGFAQIRTERLETGPLWNLKPDAHLQQVLAEYGLVPDTPKRILLFDNIQLACGRVQSRFDASARLFSILHYFGFSNVAIILDPAIHPDFPDEFAAQHQEVVRRLASQPIPSKARPSENGSLHRDRWIPKHPDHFVSYEIMGQLLAGKLGRYRL